MAQNDQSEFQALRSALDVTADAVARIGSDGRISWANEAFGNLLAASPSELVGRTLVSLAIPEHAAVVAEAVRRLGERGRAVLEASWARPGRSSIDVRAHLRAGHVVVHERAREERAETLSRTLVDLARDPGLHEGHRAEGLRVVTRTVAEALEVERVSVWISTEDDRKIQAIAVFERGPGRHSAGAVLTHEQCPRYFAALEDAHTLAAEDAQVDPRTAGFNEGYLAPLGIRALLDVPIRRDGRTIGVVCHEHVGGPRRWLPEERYFAASVADLVALLLESHERRITERLLRQAEEQLVEAQKMEALGRLAGGIAHDFNNVLSAIQGHAELIHHERTDLHGAREAAGFVEAAAQRGAGLTAQLLAFSRRQILQPTALDLDRVVREIVPMVERLLGRGIVLRVLPGATRTVLADRSQLDQVILNLCVNARDAMPRGGTLTIETRDADLDAIRASVLGAPAGGRFVTLCVADTGIGMDAETRSHLFEPFFTTKRAGGGTGLGLATVGGVVRQSGGAIEVESAPGAGTTFRVYLPCDPANGEVARRLLRGGPRRTLLLVEDDPEVRRAAHRTLLEAGFSVLEARDADEALRLSRLWRGPLHGLVTDVILPGRGGEELARTLSRARPGLGVVFTVGAGDDPGWSGGSGASRTLVKPFSPASLLDAVAHVLDVEPAPRDRP